MFEKMKLYYAKFMEFVVYQTLAISNSVLYKELNKIVNTHIYKIESEPEYDFLFSFYNKSDNYLCQHYSFFYDIEFPNYDIMFDDIEDLLEICNGDIMLYSKKDNNYICRIINEIPDSDFKDFFASEHVALEYRFIMIEYCHPGMASPVNINLSSHYYFEGNEILSDLFVERYLLHNYGLLCTFDENYTLNILDNEFNLVTLKKDAHIKLEIDSFKIEDSYKTI